jgi:threonine dehydratase
VGVVYKASPSYSLSFSQRKVVEAPSETRIADGLACRKPNAQAMEIIWRNIARIIEVSDQEIAAAMRALYVDTHNLVDGAGAAGLAAALIQKEQNHGKRIGIAVTGGNVDMDVYARVLADELE